MERNEYLLMERYEKIKALAIRLNRFPVYTEIMEEIGLASKSGVKIILETLRNRWLLNMKVHFEDDYNKQGEATL